MVFLLEIIPVVEYQTFFKNLLIFCSYGHRRAARLVIACDKTRLLVSEKPQPR